MANREARRNEASPSEVRCPEVVSYRGERIHFRPVELEEEALYRRWINDPNVWVMLGRRPPINAVQERAFLESQAKDHAAYSFVIVISAEQRAIGIAGLHRVDPVSRRARFGIMIGDAADCNQGYGSEAVRLIQRFGFEELNLNRIELGVFSNNPRAIRCYQKAGFVHEGCSRQAYYQGGVYHDVYRFAILRSEWEAGRAASNNDADLATGEDG